MILIKTILFIISFIGLFIFFKERFKIPQPLIPVVVITSIICILNLAGYLNVLKHITFCIYFCGFAVNFYYLRKSLLLKLIKEMFNDYSFILFIISIVFSIILLYNVKLVHYDNFSHWGIINKEMLALDSMPNELSKGIIYFTGYPLGSSLFIYYGCRLIGIDESIMLILQAVFIFACILPVFLFNNNKLTALIAGIFMYTMLIANSSVFNLLVDTLLPCLGFASLAIIIYYRTDIKKAFYINAPLIIALILVKNSGLFFCAVDIVVLFYFAIKTGNIKINYKYVIYTMILILSTWLLWHQHYKYVFPENIGKHSMSVSYYKNMFSQKSIEQVLVIIEGMINKLIVLKLNYIKIMLLINIFSIVFSLISLFVKKINLNYMKIVLLLDLVFVVYFVDLFLMYIFSMPVLEAIMLAGFDRYMLTVVIYITLLFCTYIIYTTANLKYNLMKNCICILTNALIIVNCFLLCNFNLNVFLLKERYINDQITKVNFTENYIHSDNSYILYAPEKYEDGLNNGYFGFVLKYKFFSNNIRYLSVNSIEKPYTQNFIKLISKYDYLVIYDEDEFIDEFCKTYFNKSEGILDTYKISDYFDINID